MQTVIHISLTLRVMFWQMNQYKCFMVKHDWDGICDHTHSLEESGIYKNSYSLNLISLWRLCIREGSPVLSMCYFYGAIRAFISWVQKGKEWLVVTLWWPQQDQGSHPDPRLIQWPPGNQPTRKGTAHNHQCSWGFRDYKITLIWAKTPMSSCSTLKQLLERSEQEGSVVIFQKFLVPT